MWQLTAGLSQVAVGTFALEVTANAPNLQLGIWSDSNGDTDMDGRTLVDIFLGGATGFNNGGQTRAVLEFTGDGLEIFEIGSTGNVNENTFSGINPGAFGFYIQPSGDDTPTWYSLDQLNPAGAPQMLAFRDTNSNLWALGFEDAAFGSGDNDFQDVVFTIESIVPVPEPGTLVLFGSGILALGLRFGARRRTVA